MNALQPENLTVDPRNAAFGDTVVIVHDLGAFFDRLKDALGPKQQVRWGGVEYIDGKTYAGDMDPFMKFREYQYQNEWRLWLPGDGTARRLTIGSMQDIAVIRRTRNLDKVLGIDQPTEPSAAD